MASASVRPPPPPPPPNPALVPHSRVAASAREKLEGAEERGGLALLPARARKAAGVRCCYLV